jgi:2-desacetyl-2-hydroxyethyl bacteriochlorophyllide A dehydrogenase
MAKTMKAVIWNGKPWFEGLSYGDFPIPEASGDWVLVRNNVCGICGSDLHFFSGGLEGKFPDKNLPAVLGHENAATVVEADPSTGFAPGDRVAVEAIHSCVNFGKTCPRCMSGQFHMCDEGMTHVGLPYVRMLPGGYGEYSAVHKSKLIRLPDSVSMEEAALLDILVVNVHAVRIGNPLLGDTCAVLGCGVVGLNLLQVLRSRGISNIFAICKYPFQEELAKKCGASKTLLYNKDTIVSDMLEMTDGQGVDQVYECVGGSSNAIDEAIGFTTRQGSVIMMGVFTGKHSIDLNGMFMREINLLSSNSYCMTGYKDEFAVSVGMLEHKQVDHDILITHRFKPDQYVEAIEAARGKNISKAVKVLFVRE